MGISYTDKQQQQKKPLKGGFRPPKPPSGSATAVDGKEVYATQEENVLCSVTGSDLTGLAPCSHEEADTRICVHV